jgi:hypothetical protein
MKRHLLGKMGGGEERRGERRKPYKRDSKKGEKGQRIMGIVGERGQQKESAYFPTFSPTLDIINSFRSGNQIVKNIIYLAGRYNCGHLATIYSFKSA